jgi:dihydrofolate reductase
MKISLIVAASENNVIGAKGGLPWHLPNDFARMKQLTMGHPIIMGRKTHESIGRVLPGRRNIVITRKQGMQIAGCDVVASLPQAFGVARQDKSDEVFIFGGGEIFRDALPQADRVYMTRVHAKIAGDTTFPELPANEWKEVSRERHEPDATHAHAYSFIDYERR